MVGEEVLQTRVAPEGKEARLVQHLDDGVVQASGEQLLQCIRRDAEAGLGPGLADALRHARLGVQAGNDAREVDDLNAAVQPYQTAPCGADLDVGILNLAAGILQAQRPVGEISGGVGGLHEDEEGLVVLRGKLIADLAHGFPQIQIAPAHHMQPLELLREVFNLAGCCQGVALRHGRGRGAEAPHIAHLEGAVRLLQCRRKGDGESGPGQVIFARHRHGDLVAEIVAAVDGIGEGRGVEGALGGDLHHHRKGVIGAAGRRECAAALALFLHLPDGARCRGSHRKAVHPGGAKLDGIHDGVGQRGAPQALLDGIGGHVAGDDNELVADDRGGADADADPGAGPSGEAELPIQDGLPDISEHCHPSRLLSAPGHGCLLICLDRSQEIRRGHLPPSAPAVGGAYAHKYGAAHAIAGPERLNILQRRRVERGVLEPVVLNCHLQAPFHCSSRCPPAGSPGICGGRCPGRRRPGR